MWDFSRHRTRVFSTLAITVLLSACQTTAAFVSDTLKRDDEKLTVLVMPMDVELSELSFAGLPTVRADWSEAANKNLKVALDAFLAKRNAETVEYKNVSAQAGPENEDVQLIKLFGAVGNAVVVHHYMPQFNLPNKEGKFDWSLGPRVQ